MIYDHLDLDHLDNLDLDDVGCDLSDVCDNLLTFVCVFRVCFGCLTEI